MTLEPLLIPELLKRFHLSPQKSLGQNFLADHNALLKIVRDAGINGDDQVLEIGAGLGNLTRVLAMHAREVVAVEIDDHLFPVLREVTQEFQNVNLVKGDILKIPMRDLFSENGYKVVANIPYYITSAVVRHLLEAEVRPEKIVLTMQREVAERIINKNSKMSLLSLSVQIYGEAHIIHHIPANCFIPAPKVDSSVLVIDVYPKPKLSVPEIRVLFRLAHAAFNQKRKMMRSSLRSILAGDQNRIAGILDRASIDPQSRPEVLTLGDWIRLTSVVAEMNLV
jgi:16S rRNA (adenine1518-N6/adenine1519-N6)-dimethyltransferase